MYFQELSHVSIQTVNIFAAHARLNFLELKYTRNSRSIIRHQEL